MITIRNHWILLGALSAFIAIVLDTFSAHAWNNLSPKMEQILQNAIDYQMYHTFALLIVACRWAHSESMVINTAGWSFVLGILCFCGSVYLLVLTEADWLRPIIITGRVFFLIGWACLAGSVFQVRGEVLPTNN